MGSAMTSPLTPPLTDARLAELEERETLLRLLPGDGYELIADVRWHRVELSKVQARSLALADELERENEVIEAWSARAETAEAKLAKAQARIIELSEQAEKAGEEGFRLLMTTRAEIKGLREAVRSAYAFITQPTELEIPHKGSLPSVLTYRTTPTRYNELTAQLRAALTPASPAPPNASQGD